MRGSNENNGTLAGGKAIGKRLREVQFFSGVSYRGRLSGQMKDSQENFFISKKKGKS